MSITALDVANTFIARHPSLYLSNLSLNKLVYFAQMESLRQTGSPCTILKSKHSNTDLLCQKCITLSMSGEI